MGTKAVLAAALVACAILFSGESARFQEDAFNAPNEPLRSGEAARIPGLGPTVSEKAGTEIPDPQATGPSVPGRRGSGCKARGVNVDRALSRRRSG